MAKKEVLPIPVVGPLDTANPSTNRAPGTLITALDAAHRWIGPRRGGKSVTWVRQSPYTIPPGSINDVELDGTNGYVKGITQVEQADLGLAWTLDLCFHATATRAVSGAVPIFQWRVGSNNAIEVGVYGSATGAGLANKLYAIVKTTSSAGVVGHTYTLTGGTPIYSASYVSANKIVRCFVRLIRDGTTLTMIDTTPNTTSTTISATEPHQGGTDGSWLYANDSGLGVNGLFKGSVPKAMIRAEAVSTSYPIPSLEHGFPFDGNVRFFATSKLGQSPVHITDYSAYGAHGLVSSGASASVARNYPHAMRTLGMSTFTDQYAVTTATVAVGGNFYYQRLK